MGFRYDIDNYSERYQEYGARVLKDSEAVLNKAGIKVFSFDQEKQDDNGLSCVVVNNKNPEPEKPKKKETSDKKSSDKKSNLGWIRESLPTANNVMSIHSIINKKVSEALAKKTSIKSQSNVESSQEDDYDNNEYNYVTGYNDHDLFDAESDVSNVDTMSNASGDEGQDPLLNLFEKEIKNEGLSSSSFFGANYERDINTNSFSKNVSAYTDNLYRKGKTSIVFGGTMNVDYNPNKSGGTNNQVDYNAYSFGKYKTSKITYGAGVLGMKKDGVDNITIDIGAMHNETGIYGIIKKDITIVPGLPTQTNTNVNVGIGKSSGILDFEEYRQGDKKVQEISDVDNAAQQVKNQESGIFDDVDPETTKKSGTTIVNLVISDTNNYKEYGVKGGYLLKYSKLNKNNYAIMPYGQISNISVDSDDGSTDEGARLILGVNAGQKANLGYDWQISTKGLVEASRTVMSGMHPSDYLLANVCFKAQKRNFSSELSVGGFYTNSNTNCKYAELKLSYNVGKDFSVNLNGGYANSKFANNNSELYQVAGGVSYSF